MRYYLLAAIIGLSACQTVPFDTACGAVSCPPAGDSVLTAPPGVQYVPEKPQMTGAMGPVPTDQGLISAQLPPYPTFARKPAEQAPAS